MLLLFIIYSKTVYNMPPAGVNISIAVTDYEEVPVLFKMLIFPFPFQAHFDRPLKLTFRP